MEKVKILIVEDEALIAESLREMLESLDYEVIGSAMRAKEALDLLQVDAKGLDETDRRYLRIMIDRFNGGPVGIESLAAALGDERGTIEDVVEPYLVQQGFVVRSARGRMAASLAYAHFGMTPLE